MSIRSDLTKHLDYIKVLSERDFPLDPHGTGKFSLLRATYADLTCFPVALSLAQLRNQQTNGQKAHPVRFVSYHMASHIHGFIRNACTYVGGKNLYEQALTHHKNLVPWHSQYSAERFYIDSLEGCPLPPRIDGDRLTQSILTGLTMGYAQVCKERDDTASKIQLRKRYPFKVVMLVRADLVDQKGFDRISSQVQRHLTP